MKRKTLVIIPLLVTGLLLGGCEKKMQEEEVELTDRQCEILWSMDLPADWSKLTSSQRKSITAIEEMLDYLDNKYDKKFCYAGYKLENPIYLDKEELLAYAEGDNPEMDIVSVFRTEDGFTDDYDRILANPSFHEEVQAGVADALEGYTYKMFTEVYKVNEDGSVKSADVDFFIEGVKKDEAKEFAYNLEAVVYDIPGVYETSIYFMKDNTSEKVNESSWDEDLDLNDVVDKYFENENTWRDEK